MTTLQEFLTSANIPLESVGLPGLMEIFWAVVIYIMGRWLARRSRIWYQKATRKSPSAINVKLINLVGQAIYYGILMTTIVLSLTALGVPLEMMLFVLALAFVLVAIALQTSLSNLAATIIFWLFQTYRTGDWIDVAGGTFGQVQEIQLFNTVLVTQDRQTITIPNGRILQNNIINFSELGVRRADMRFVITYQSDLRQAKELLQNVLNNHELILKELPPTVGVSELGDRGVTLLALPYTEIDNFWRVKFSVMETIKLLYDEAGIALAIPQQDVYVHQPAQETT